MNSILCPVDASTSNQQSPLMSNNNVDYTSVSHSGIPKEIIDDIIKVTIAAARKSNFSDPKLELKTLEIGINMLEKYEVSNAESEDNLELFIDLYHLELSLHKIDLCRPRSLQITILF